MSLDKKNLVIRTISGLVYAGLLIGAVILGPLALAIVTSVFAVIGCYELEKYSIGQRISNWKPTAFVDAAALVFLIFSAVYTSAWSPLCVWIFITLIFLRFFLQVFVSQKEALFSIALFPFVLMYIGVPLALMVLSRSVITNAWVIVCILSMIWINDTGAYLVGCSIGRHKMFPRLSPKKSWEGFLGGLLFNIAAAFIFFYCFKLNGYLLLSNVQGWIFIGICVTVFSTLGDLFESMLKRSIGVKDLGSVIPGHGGILDRIDSLLCVVPCVIVAVILVYQMFGL